MRHAQNGAMPRCHIRCNIITDPGQVEKNRLSCVDLLPYLQCFYHVPVKDVYEVLGMSHHTLAPIRRKRNLHRWPFADICRGSFFVDGRHVSWQEVEDRRRSMMIGADPRIAKILEVMGQRAQFHKHKVNVVIARKRKEEQSMTSKLLATTVKRLHHVSEEQQQAMDTQEGTSCPAVTAQPDDAPGEVQAPTTTAPEDIIPSDAEWLDSFSRLLAAELDAPPGELFPPLFD